MRIIGGPEALPEICADYHFLCDRFLEEELYFRRNGSYRLSRFEDALAEVYANSAGHGALHELRAAHPRHVGQSCPGALSHFESVYLPSLPPNARHLEIGPGHGLLLHLASQAPAVASATGWDVSETSIDHARRCLAAMGGSRPVDLVRQDLLDARPGGQRFDSIVLSEVLEHLEDPRGALQAVAEHHASPGARLWVNVPVNSPAPDHIYLLRTPEAAVELVRSAGFEQSTRPSSR